MNSNSRCKLTFSFMVLDDKRFIIGIGKRIAIFVPLKYWYKDNKNYCMLIYCVSMLFQAA